MAINFRPVTQWVLCVTLGVISLGAMLQAGIHWGANTQLANASAEVRRAQEARVILSAPAQECAVVAALPEVAPKTSYYNVKKGSNLWDIAEEVYGDGNLYPIIARENGHEYPYIIQPGENLMIPDPAQMSESEKNETLAKEREFLRMLSEEENKESDDSSPPSVIPQINPSSLWNLEFQENVFFQIASPILLV